MARSAYESLGNLCQRNFGDRFRLAGFANRELI